MMLFFTALAGISTAITAILMLYDWWHSRQPPIYWTVNPIDDNGTYLVRIWFGSLRYNSYTVNSIKLISDGNPVITGADVSLSKRDATSLQLDWMIPAQTVGFQSEPERFSLSVENVVTTTDLLLNISTKSFPKRRTLLISLVKTQVNTN